MSFDLQGHLVFCDFTPQRYLSLNWSMYDFLFGNLQLSCFLRTYWFLFFRKLSILLVVSQIDVCDVSDAGECESGNGFQGVVPQRDLFNILQALKYVDPVPQCVPHTKSIMS